jgi:hypothetical protein
VSDLFKRHRPRLSEDEERALWERVRTIPREAAGERRSAGGRKRSPWDVLWARPAVRYGAPALAVALVAVVWVAQKEPVAPARQEAARRNLSTTPATETVPSEERAQVGARDAPGAPTPAPLLTTRPPAAATAPAPAGRDLDRAVAQEGATVTGNRMLKAAEPGNERLAERESGGSRIVRGGRAVEVIPESDTGPTSASGRLDYVTPPPAAVPAPGSSTGGAAGTAAPAVRKERQVVEAQPQAVKDFYRENPRVGKIQAVDEAKADGGRVDAVRAARGSRASAAILGDRILVEVLVPSGSGTFLASVTLPLSGGVARIAAGPEAGSLWVEDGNVRDLIRIAGREGDSGQATRRQIELDPGGRGAGAAAIVAPDGRALSSRFVPEGGGERSLDGPGTTARSRTAGLAAELILAVASGNPGAVERVRDASHRLAAERPNDEAARTLVAWSDDAHAAFTR